MTAPAGVAGRLAGHGLVARLPQRWEGRVYQRASASPSTAAPTASTPAAPTASTPAAPAPSASGAAQPRSASLPAGAGWLGERPHPVLHLANFALPAQRGDFGSGAVELMSERSVFIALLQFGPECLGTALYASRGLPSLSPADFDPNALQRRLRGQTGCQRFCTVEGRPFCLYVVLGSDRLTADLSREADAIVRQIEVTP